MVGADEHGTKELFQLRALVNGRACELLVDSGATNNFLSKQFASKNALETDMNAGQVVYADGRTTDQVAKLSKPVHLRVGGHSEQVQFTVADLQNGFDGILGMPWLMAHEPAMKWKKREMVIKFGQRRVCLKASTCGNLEVKKTTARIAHVTQRQMKRDLHTKGEHRPPYRPIYKMSPVEMEEARTQIEELLAKGRICPSRSPYGAPILFAKMKNRQLRMCIDYRALNDITKKNQFPIPRIDEMLEKLRGARGVLVYLDDILIYANSCQQHLKLLKEPTTEYLGHLILEEGIQMDPEKVRVVVEWPTPRDASYYAVGAVLQQDLGEGVQPIAYFSRKLKDAETQPSLSRRQARWLEFFQQFDFEVRYKKRFMNRVADALSRLHVAHVRTAVNIQSEWRNDFVIAYDADSEAREARKAIAQGDSTWSERDGPLWKGAKLYVPDLPHVRLTLIKEAHDLLCRHPIVTRALAPWQLL